MKVKVSAVVSGQKLTVVIEGDDADLITALKRSAMDALSSRMSTLQSLEIVES